MEALHNLGIDGKLLLAQVVNFLILLFILRKFAYRPMLEFLEKRTARIEQGIRDAEAAGVKLVEIGEAERRTLASARAEARDIIAAAEDGARKRDLERAAETEAKVQGLLEEARVKMEEERRKVLSEAKDEIASLVVLTAEKVMREKLDAGKDGELVKRFLNK